MIDEIFDEYEKQQKENFLMIGKHFGIEGEFLSRPNANHDLIIILKNTNLLNEEIDSFELIDDFYEKIVKEGILFGLGFGKAHMIKKVMELPLSKNEISEIDLDDYNEFFPKFDESKSVLNEYSEDGMKRVLVTMNAELSDIEKEAEEVLFIAKIIDKNHNELKKILYEEFLDVFEIDREKAKYGFQKNIRINSEILRPQIRSRFFKEKEGTFKVKEILEDYFELMIDTGAEIGIKVGFGIVIEDIQKDQINYDKLKSLSETEIMMYIQKEHSDYIFKKHNNGAC